MVVNVLPIFEERSGHRPRLAIRTVDRLRAVLWQIDAAHALCLVRAAAMKHIAVKGYNAPRRHNHCITRIAPRIADKIIRSVLLGVADDGALCPPARVRQQINSAVLLANIIQRAPARHIRLVLCCRVVPLHVTTILMPGELHPLLSALDHPLLMEEVRFIAHRRARDLRHQIAEDELPQPITQPIAIVDEVALPTVADVFRLNAFRVHDRIVITEIVGALFAQHLQHWRRDDSRKDHVTFVTIEFALLLGDFHARNCSQPATPLASHFFGLLSFFVGMLQRLKLPAGLNGRAWRYANPAGANRRHHHAELELNLVTRGTGTYLLGNRQYQIRRGDLLWLFPVQEHVLIEQTSDFQMWIVVFRRRLIKRAAIDRTFIPLLQRSFSGDACRRLQPPDLSRFEDLFAQLTDADGEPSLLNAGLAYALLHAWQCFERAGEVTAHNVHPGVESTARLLLTDVNSYTLPQLARRAALSPSRLSRLFKQQTGLSTVEFRNRQRMQRFLDRYESERDAGRQSTLLDAALAAGFGSYPQFHRVFRQVTGCSPAEYQRRQS